MTLHNTHSVKNMIKKKTMQKSCKSAKSAESVHKQSSQYSAQSNERNMSPAAATTMSNTRTALISLTNKGAFSVEHILAEKMHKSRYQCKMNL